MQNGQPILPKTPKAPTMTIGVNNAADRRIKSAMRSIQNGVLELLNDIPKKRSSAVESGVILNAEVTYKYEITPQIVGQIPGEIGRIIELNLLENNAVNWFMYEAVEKAEEMGVGAEVANLQAQTVPTEYPVTVQSALMAPQHIARVELAKNRVFNEMQGLSAEMKTQLSRILSTGMANGDGPKKIADKIYKQIGLPEWNDGGDKASYARALRIARTEINEAHRKAREGERDVARGIGLNIGVMHLSAMLPTTRRWHARRHGWVGTEQEENAWFERDGNSINCFTPDTEVSGRFIGGSKAWYEGRMVEIVTTGGRRLTVTPNHPVLTSKGLVAAGKITKGDNLFASLGDVDNATLRSILTSHQGFGVVTDLNSDKVNPAISEVYSSLVELGHTFSRGVSVVDFHGDGEFIKKDVDVVLSDRVLVATGQSKAFEFLDEVNFVKTDSILGSGKSSLLKRVSTILRPSSGNIRSFRDRFPFFFGSFGKAIKVTFGTVPLFEAVFLKPSNDSNPSNSNFFRNLKDTFTEFVLPVDFKNIKGIDLLHRAGVYLNSVFLKDAPNDSMVDVTERLSDATDRFAREISVDDVLLVREYDFCGHVYDLQEVSGLMVANGVIVSNCRCTTISIILDKNGKPKNPQFKDKVIKQRERYEEKEGIE